MRTLLGSLDLDLVARSHGWYDLAPFRYDERLRMLETLHASGESTIRVSLRQSRRRVWAASTPDFGSTRELKTVCDRILQKFVDLAPFHLLCAERGEGFGWIAERGAGRMLCSPTLFEDAVKVLLTTNCSWGLTKSMVSRLIEICGQAGAFPGPESIAVLSEETLRLEARCGYRAPFLLSFARGVAEGQVDLSRWEDPGFSAGELEVEIRKNKGFGPYAAHTLLRLLGRHAKLGLDSWSRKKAAELRFDGRPASDREIESFYSVFGDWAGLAFWLDVTAEWHEGHETLW